jgi:uncharacterized membrane protein
MWWHARGVRAKTGGGNVMAETIGNPLSWAARRLGAGLHRIEGGTVEIAGTDTAPIIITGLQIADLRIALKEGLEDFLALRTDVVFVVLIYPIIGLALAGITLNRDMLPLLFPMISGFALLGPLAAVGLYEMSRRRALGLQASWADAFGVLGSPSLFPILTLGFYLFGIFLAWLLCANQIYNATLGPAAPVSVQLFVQDIFTTSAGRLMGISGIAVGFVFASAVLALSLVSFPLLLDRRVGVVRAVVTSLRVARRAPLVAAAWGAVVVIGLGLGVLTLFVGLMFVLPVLGHASWHLYRRAVAPPLQRTNPQGE